MKRVLFVLFSSLMLFSCQKAVPEVSDRPFKITTHYTATTSAWLDVLPETNDFYWYIDAIPVSEFNAKGSVEACIADTDKEIKELFEEYLKGGLVGGSFPESMLYRGSFLTAFIPLENKTKYIAYAYAYEEDGTPTNKYQTVQFQTNEYIASDMTFSISLKGSELTFIPSNDDPYFWSYELKSKLDEEWDEEYQYNHHVLAAYNNIYYGFLDFLEMHGPHTEDASGYVKLKEGDKFIVFVSGYNHDINTCIYKYECTYAGEGQEGTVVYLNKYEL